jgi:hypothetical protein
LQKLLSRISFRAFYAYSPRGSREDKLHRASQVFCEKIKNDSSYAQGSAIELAIERLRKEGHPDFELLFEPGVILVPAPSSSPTPRDLDIPLRGGEKDFHWVPRRICEALVVGSRSASWLPLLRRDSRVTRSSRAQAQDRPTPLDHFESLSCRRELLAARRYVVVDDVVTRGATLLACASRLQEAYPEAEILGFALLRSESSPEKFLSILDPRVGTISLRLHGDTLRRP